MAIWLFALNEEWHLSMYDYMRTNSIYVALFWIAVIVITELITVRLFLALFINKYIELAKETKCIEGLEEDPFAEFEDDLSDISASFIRNP